MRGRGDADPGDRTRADVWGRRALTTLALCGALLATAGSAGASHAVLTLDSIGPAGGNGPFNPFFAAVSADGSRVFVETDEPLVAADTDAFLDVYERSGGTTTLVSTGPAGGNGAFDAFYAGSTASGARVFLETDEPLVAADTDASFDVYERAGGTTSLVSGGSLELAAFFRGVSADGSAVFFETDEALVAGDTDAGVDVYRRTAGGLALVSGPDEAPAWFDAASADGSRVLFETDAQLVPGDTDAATDVYRFAGGAFELVTGGAADVPAFFRAASADAGRVVFETSEQLAAADDDAVTDVYRAGAGGVELLSGGAADVPARFRTAAGDLGRVVFETDEPLAAADEDGLTDVYATDGGSVTLQSASAVDGVAAAPVFLVGASADAGRLFLETAERLLEPDADGLEDVYARSGGVTTLLSGGGSGVFGVTFAGASADGAEVFLSTPERLLDADTDGSYDVYERTAGVTSLVSTGQAGGNGPFGAFVAGVSADGSRVVFSTFERLVDADTDLREDVYSASLEPAGESAPPVVTVAVAAGERQGASGWFDATGSGTDGVTVAARAADPDGVARLVCTDGAAVVLDVAAATGSFVLRDGRHSVACEATDAAQPPSTGTAPGSTPMPLALDVDQTAPTLACTTPAPGPVFVLRGAGGAVTATVTDAVSGPAAPTASADAAVSAVGNRTAALTARDAAGNEATAACPYRVSYAVVVERGPKPSVKAGSQVQVRFALTDAAGAPIADAEAGALGDACRATVTLAPAAAECARYESGKRTFRADVKTDKATPRGSRDVTVAVSAPDGSGVVAETPLPIEVR
ncbi:MAG TPA: hypothetical protein VFR43_09490 [Gaiellaceae bacterium]|nr:hypothetical protein [Gaiellaceae bacterium]